MSDDNHTDPAGETLTPDLAKEIKELKKQLKDSTKTTDELKGQLERQKNSKERWDTDKKDLQILIEKYRAQERQTLVDKIKIGNPKFKLEKNMTDEFLKGYAKGSVVDERGSPPPKIPSGESTGERTLTEKETMIANLLS